MEEFSTGAANNTQKLLLILIGLSICVNLISIIGFSLRDWDEGVFALQGQWLTSGFSQGKPYNFQTPPLYPVIAGVGMLLVKGDPMILPVFSFLFSIATLIIIYYLGKHLYGSETAIFAIALFTSTELFFFFSKSGLSDAMFLFFFSIAFLNIVRNKKGRMKYFMFSGAFITLAMYTKYSGIVLLAYAIITGIIMGMHKNWKWYVFQIAIPIILFSPLIFLYIKFTPGTNIEQRFAELIGINYHNHLYYLIAFAPAPVILGCSAQFKRSKENLSNKIIIFSIIIYFILLGLYYPYFRLDYPLIMLMAIAGASLNIQPGLKNWIILVTAIIGIAFSVPTIIYQNRIPVRYANEVKRYIGQENIKILYSTVPPNIEYYLQGNFTVMDNHPWFTITETYPVFRTGHRILYRSENELKPGEEILIAHASINDSIKSVFPDIFTKSQLILSYKFIDAPLYQKDIFNRPQEQRFELYKLKIDDQSLADKIWQMGFKKGISVLVY
ncbi:hypothetical protein A2Y85_05190 [candidate division WOR-3 bacterium RBG_13_43_14]|uniref:Glycosyltransferase RgtA/B/C/D-like domain-containing protein n=1 Tax=candidate division WOR-3 bacterium RBG_13_43_14 TaxID=1802590 RepID=A0A1F4U8B5_UNCW3|nr:MAG: hypothetical protein A2Y85_05190 [candidate division WOR-3 bacterium RBG_13_43_14]